MMNAASALLLLVCFCFHAFFIIPREGSRPKYFVFRSFVILASHPLPQPTSRRISCDIGSNSLTIDPLRLICQFSSKMLRQPILVPKMEKFRQECSYSLTALCATMLSTNSFSGISFTYLENCCSSMARTFSGSIGRLLDTPKTVSLFIHLSIL